MTNKITRKAIYILIGILCVVLSSFLFYVNTIIDSTVVSVYSPFEVNIDAELTNCLSSLKGQSYLFLSDKKVEDLVTSCDTIVIGNHFRASFPRSINVRVDVILPSLMHTEELEDGSEQCTVFQSSDVYAVLDSSRCMLYDIPEIDRPNIPNDSFRDDYLILIEEPAKKRKINVVHIQEKGDTLITWYDLSLDSGVHVYLPQGDELEDKINTLAATLKGLQNAGEKYKTIDLRFDRVVYK